MSKTCKSCDYDFSEKVNMKEHTEPLHIEKRLNKISICDHAYFQKSEMRKHHESVYSKDRSHNCSVCETSSSRNGHFGKTCQSFLCGHDVTKLAEVVTMIFLKKSILKSILIKFIQGKGEL